MQRKINIHGDNIVECERAFSMCRTALSLQNVQFIKSSSVFCPSYSASENSTEYIFTFFPSYGRWNENILQLVQNRTDSLRESPDVLITEVKNDSEQALIAIEYCGALPAGNQAWQRNGRGFSIGKSGIPYFYVAELGGYELDSERNRKAARLPNPAVPFSYLSYSMKDIVALPIYIRSAGSDAESDLLYRDVFSEKEFTLLVSRILHYEDFSNIQKEIANKIFSFVKIKARASTGNATMSEQNWIAARDVLYAGKSLVDFCCENQVRWKKTAYISGLTKTASKFMEITSSHAVGFTSSKLPFCIIPKTNKQAYISDLLKLYKSLPPDFINWLKQEEHLVIVFVMGFKPRGDDARPDRGLVPFTRMLAGNNTKILTFVYGPAPKETWKMMQSNPAKLAQTNGLWEAVYSATDALFIDSSTSNMNKKCFLKNEFKLTNKTASKQNIIVSTVPVRIGENDVDTILHTLLKNIFSIKIFEGLCNPPGGDWSGISLFDIENEKEYRWLSLPRVSSSNAKRPDHVFQLYGIESKPVILSVESKEKAGDLENDIGNRLTRYITDLMKTPASTERKINSSDWNISDKIISEKDFVFASAVAYIAKADEDETALKVIKQKVATDILFSYTFSIDGSCQIKMISCSKIGKDICSFISAHGKIQNKISLIEI